MNKKFGKRVGVFVDAQNLSPKGCGFLLNYHVLLQFVKCFGEVVISAVYIGQNYLNHKFFVTLKRLGFNQISLIPTKQLPNGNIKCNVDVTLAFDLARYVLSCRLDTVILCTGDSDFAKPVEILRNMGVRVIVLGPNNATGWEIITVADTFYYIDEIEGLAQPLEVTEKSLAETA